MRCALRCRSSALHPQAEKPLIIAGLAASLFALGLNHQTAPLAVRERVVFHGSVDNRTLAGLYRHSLLFLHGARGASMWLPFMEKLAERFDVIVPEHPGFGASDTPDWLDTVGDLAYFYLDLMERFGLQGVHLIGTSLGGWIALTPELPAKLLFGRHVWDCAQHADRWGRRLPELRAPLGRDQVAGTAADPRKLGQDVEADDGPDEGREDQAREAGGRRGQRDRPAQDRVAVLLDPFLVREISYQLSQRQLVLDLVSIIEDLSEDGSLRLRVPE